MPPALAVINSHAEILLYDLKIQADEKKPVWKTFGYHFGRYEEKSYGAIQDLMDGA